MRLLFITATRIGDAVLSTGILGQLIAATPGLRVTVACGPAAANLFAAVPGLERVIVLDKKRYGLHWLELWRQTVGTKWHLVVDLRGSATAWFLRAWGRRILRGSGRGQPRVERLAQVLGVSPPPLPRVWLRPQDHARALQLVPPGPPVIALGPTANWQGKVWAPERFVALFDALTGAGGPLPGARAAVLGGTGATERALAEPVLRALPARRVIDLVGRIELLEAAACLQRSALFVGNDSGLMHLSAATGIPTLGLFGPSPPEEYAPVGRYTAFARTHKPMRELVGGPGYDWRTTGSLMDSLPVSDAVAAARALLSRAAGNHSPREVAE